MENIEDNIKTIKIHLFIKKWLLKKIIRIVIILKYTIHQEQQNSYYKILWWKMLKCNNSQMQRKSIKSELIISI